MKKIFFLLSIVSLGLASCEKFKDSTPYGFGTTGSIPILSISASVVAPAVADSANAALALSWTDTYYATNPSTIKYIVQLDAAGSNFSNPVTITVNGVRTVSLLAKDLNAAAVARGFVFGVARDMEAKVISSYANNNEQYTSKTIKFSYKAYVIPPIVALPASGKLYIVGDGSTFGWTNPSIMPVDRTFSRVSNTSWGGLFYMNGSGAYKLLQTPGDWGSQFHMLSGGNASAGFFEQRDADPAFPSPATAGWYSFTFDFQLGKYQVTAFPNTPPQELYVTGNVESFANAWVNNPPMAQKFTRLNSAEYEITLAMTPGKVFKFLSNFGNWQPQFGAGPSTGFLGANYGGGSDPGTIDTPATAGNYKITINFYTGTYKLERV